MEMLSLGGCLEETAPRCMDTPGGWRVRMILHLYVTD